MATREYLDEKLCVIPYVSVTHKGELRKLANAVGKERMIIQGEPEHAEGIAAFCAQIRPGVPGRKSVFCGWARYGEAATA